MIKHDSKDFIRTNKKLGIPCFLRKKRENAISEGDLYNKEILCPVIKKYIQRSCDNI